MWATLLGSLLGGSQDSKNKKSRRESNLSPTAQAQLQQAQSLAPAGTEIKPPNEPVQETASIPEDQGSGNGFGGTLMSLMSSVANQPSQNTTSNAQNMKRQQYQQMLQSLMSKQPVNTYDAYQMMRYLQG